MLPFICKAGSCRNNKLHIFARRHSISTLLRPRSHGDRWICPYTWSVTSAYATLPEGMSINAATGVISASSVGGQGGYQFQVQAKDSSGATATSLLTINVTADNTLGGCSIFPANSIFHQRVDSLPVDTSPAAPIYSGYQSSHLRVFFGSDTDPYPDGIPFIRVPYNQPPLSMTFSLYGDESDAPNGWSSSYVTTYPFPANAPIEATANNEALGGDGHVLILQTAGGGQPCKLWEVWQAVHNSNGTWSSSNGAYWDLSSNNLRTNGWTSGDAAGLPIMPLTVNYDEVASGVVTHPIRFTVNHMLNGYVWPGRHPAGVGYCTGSGGVVIPAGSELSQSSPPVSCTMTGPAGEIYRLTSAAYATAMTTCPSSNNPEANVILTAMRQYGIILADNGLTGGVIGTPDARWNDTDLACLTNFTLAQFEPVNVSSLQQSADSGATSNTGTYTLSVTMAGSGSGSVTTNSGTISWSGTTGSASYGSGTSVTLTATPMSGSTFTSWAGCDSTTGAACTVTMTSAKSVTATFSVTCTTYTVSPTSLTVIASGSTGTISVSASSGCTWNVSDLLGWITITSGSSGTGSGTVGYSVSPNTNTSSRSGNITIAGDTVMVLQSGVAQYALTVVESGTGTGTVTSSPSGISCGSTCSASYNSGTSVTLTATPSTGSTFTGWSGGCSGTGVCTVPMTAVTSVTAEFNATSSSCTYSTNYANLSFGPSGGANSIGVAPSSTTCSWTATSNVYWITMGSPICSGTQCTASYTVAANTTGSSRSGTITVAGQTFTITQAGSTQSQYSLTITKAGTGSGSISSTTGTITWNGNTGTATYASGTTVTLSDVPDSGSSFSSWGGCDEESLPSNNGTCLVEMNASKSVVITFGGTSSSCTYSINSASQSVGSAGSTGSVSVTPSSSTCTWSASSDSSWLTISPGNGTGSGAVSYLVSPNTSAVYRIGTITIAGQAFVVTQAGQTSGTNVTVGSAGAYSTIQSGYNGSAAGDVIQIPAGSYTENLALSNNVSVTLKGGYDSSYLTSSSYSTINGTLTISNGSVTVGDLIIQ